MSGEEGNFNISITQHPRYVDANKCIACGLCAEKCPTKVKSEYNEGLNNRKAIYVNFEQAVPLKYAIDHKHCLFFTKGKCRICEKFCPSEAIDFEEEQKEITLNVGSVILTGGLDTFDPKNFQTFVNVEHISQCVRTEQEKRYKFA